VGIFSTALLNFSVAIHSFSKFREQQEKMKMAWPALDKIISSFIKKGKRLPGYCSSLTAHST
jgi:hypothetical protein